jgi:glycosyltransferase involved in cell wall biosynthesis
MNTIPISVLILTRNEARDLPDCLQSVAWSDDVHVLDSLSDDATAVIAEAYGAKVTWRSFDGYASQRNFGLGLPFRHEWILSVDADERIPPELAREMRDFIAQAPPTVGAARIRGRYIWWGRDLRHAQITPWFVRLVRKGHARYEREINEVLRVDGEIHDLRREFDHFPFSKGLDHWIAKHNTYSRMEAELIFRRLVPRASIGAALFAKDFHERRRHQKALFYRLPCRPLVKFAYMLLVRRAFLDGWPGIRYALLQSIYEYFITLKVQEFHATEGPREPSKFSTPREVAPGLHRNPSEAP